MMGFEFIDSRESPEVLAEVIRHLDQVVALDWHARFP